MYYAIRGLQMRYTDLLRERQVVVDSYLEGAAIASEFDMALTRAVLYGFDAGIEVAEDFGLEPDGDCREPHPTDSRVEDMIRDYYERGAEGRAELIVYASDYGEAAIIPVDDDHLDQAIKALESRLMRRETGKLMAGGFEQES
jgi:hypothetical protein